MYLLLGEKRKFAIEAEILEKKINDKLMGYARLWLGGVFFGTFSDYIYIDGYLLGGLSQIIKTKELSYADFPETKESQYSYLLDKNKNLDDEIDFYTASFGTFSDNFVFWVYKQGTQICFLWRIRNNDFNLIHTELKEYPKEVFSYKMEYKEYVEFVNRFQRIISNW